MQFQNLGLGQKGIFGNKYQAPRPPNNRSFCYFTIIKCFQISKIIQQKVLLGIFSLGPFFINFSIATLKIYHHRAKHEIQRLKRQFWKWHD